MLVRREGGMTLDAAREAAEQEGFPGTEDLPSFIDTIDRAQRGEDMFRARDAAEADAWRQALAGRRAPPTAMDLLEQRAAGLGIKAESATTPEDLLAAVHEREALMAEGAARGPLGDRMESEIDAQLAHEDLPWEWNDVAGQGEARTQPGAAGSVEGARGKGERPGAEGETRSAGAEPSRGADAAPAGDADAYDVPLTDAERAFALNDPQTREELLAAFDQTQAAENRGAAITQALSCLLGAGA